MSGYRKPEPEINSAAKKKKIAQLIIARLDGRDINRRFNYYHSLVKKGIGGFIVFGGKPTEVRKGVKNLQDSAEVPLFITSDLEQGLGQQIEGGTLFPPAMAVGKAVNRKDKNDIQLLRKSIGIIAQEARALGINVIFSPVLDVNTNPENPIICTRAFSDNPEKVTWFGKEFIKGFQEQGIIACAKHFPGHGDTIKDSHRELPVVQADMKRLDRVELYPFRQAVRSGVRMIMVGHLKVPALDSKFPSSLSQKIIQNVLKEKMGFQGLVITDAMNMHAVSGRKQESAGKACMKALQAGADILLHPDNPDKMIEYLFLKWGTIEPEVHRSFRNIRMTKKRLYGKGRSRPGINRIGTRAHWKTAKALTQQSINVTSSSISEVKTRLYRAGLNRELTVLLVDDDNAASGTWFKSALKGRFKKVKMISLDNRYKGDIKEILHSVSGTTMIAAVFSKVSAGKGRSGLSRKLQNVLKKTVKASHYSVVAGFCCPHTLTDLKADVVIEAYSGSGLAQKAVAEVLFAP